jgi:2,5-diketo-D-gluconate reductase A
MTSAAAIPTVTLNDDNAMPVIGIGVGELPEARAEESVRAALEAGYRLIDTSPDNEAAVGRAIAGAGVPRDELYVITRLSPAQYGFQSGQDALKASLQRLGLEYVDLYLLDGPTGEQGKYIDSWGGVMKSKEKGDTRSIGVRGFADHHLDDVISLSFFTPAVNQIEVQPLLNQAPTRAFHADNGIATVAAMPLAAEALVGHAAVGEIAGALGRTPAQVLLRWSLQLGNVVVALFPAADQIEADVLGFELDEAQMAALNGLDDGTRFLPDPEIPTAG